MSDSAALRRRRAALLLLFLVPGLVMSSWVTRTPDVRDRLGASTGEMGLVLFGVSVGSMAGVLCSGRLVAWLGTRRVIAVGTALSVLSLLVVGLGALAPSAPLVAVGLCVLGAGMGGAEVAVNIEGADVERLTGRVLLPTLHGFYSLGTVVGAALGILCTAVRAPVHWHLFAICAVTAGIAVHAVRGVPAGAGRAADAAAAGEGGGPVAAQAAPVWRDRRLLMIGGIILAMALAEGAANDWLPLLLVDGHDLGAAAGSAGYAGFAVAMTVGRMCGTPVIGRIGRGRTMRISALCGVAGLALVIAVDSSAVAVAAVALWGLGASLGFPVALSAAGDSGPNPAARVGLAATIGYFAFLVGPPSLGFLGDHFGLRAAMGAVLVFVVAAVFLAPAAGDRRAGDRGAVAPDEGELAVEAR